MTTSAAVVAHFRVSSSLTQETTPEELDALMRANPSCKWRSSSQQGTLLHKVSYLGNVRLIDHIVHKGGRELLESTEGLGLTPLFSAATHNHLAATKRLLQLGANVNARQVLDHREVNILSCIDVQPHCMPMAKLLIVNGAAGELDSNFLAEAQRQVKLEGKQYLAALFNGESLQEMPIELTKIIAEYSKWHPEIQPPAPPQPVPPSSCCSTT